MANGAARQAAAVLVGSFLSWDLDAQTVPAPRPAPDILDRYRRVAAIQAVQD